jgi:hypothetical protein
MFHLKRTSADRGIKFNERFNIAQNQAQPIGNEQDNVVNLHAANPIIQFQNGPISQNKTIHKQPQDPIKEPEHSTTKQPLDPIKETKHLVAGTESLIQQLVEDIDLEKSPPHSHSHSHPPPPIDKYPFPTVPQVDTFSSMATRYGPKLLEKEKLSQLLSQNLTAIEGREDDVKIILTIIGPSSTKKITLSNLDRQKPLLSSLYSLPSATKTLPPLTDNHLNWYFLSPQTTPNWVPFHGCESWFDKGGRICRTNNSHAIVLSLLSLCHSPPLSPPKSHHDFEISIKWSRHELAHTPLTKLSHFDN